ncbi:MAG: aminoacyl-tRNA hydrolase [Desulfosarcinaceae bacterium]
MAGLGNPGDSYAASRHNIGFRVVTALAASASIRMTRDNESISWGRGRIFDRDVILAQPMAYMNRSGPPIRRLMTEQQIGREALLVIHDDIDLAFGRLKIKEKGGDGGHRGVQSLIDALGSRDFGRLRIGIGRPAGGIEVVDYVLGVFEPDEARALDALIDNACEAVRTVLTDGIRTAMNRFNMREP